MYKLLNLFFGWDYVGWNDFLGSGISRLKKDHLNRPFYRGYNGNFEYIDDKKDVTWLTCKPEKYGFLNEK